MWDVDQRSFETCNSQPFISWCWPISTIFPTGNENVPSLGQGPNRVSFTPLPYLCISVMCYFALETTCVPYSLSFNLTCKRLFPVDFYPLVTFQRAWFSPPVSAAVPFWLGSPLQGTAWWGTLLHVSLGTSSLIALSQAQGLRHVPMVHYNSLYQTQTNLWVAHLFSSLKKVNENQDWQFKWSVFVQSHLLLGKAINSL